MTARQAGDRRRIERLVTWFERHRRDLPWRRVRTGYTALVAEAMLQQTQVSRVVDRFQAFILRFPSVDALAAADEQEVLAAWQGLGYYRRARHLHAAARAIVERCGGEVPSDADQLARLPGVGRYTAGAIASIVHDRPSAIVDGNVKRVLARWDGDDGLLDERDADKRSWRRAEELVRLARTPGAFNEALMELGALVCTPRAPKCLLCPVAGDCVANRTGRAESIPPPRKAATPKPVHHHAVVIVRKGTLLLERRPDRGLWSAMWQPPTVESETPLRSRVVTSQLAERGLTISSLERRGDFEHRTTHRRVTFHVFTARTRRRRGDWLPMDELDHVPMSNAHRRLVRDFVVDQARD